MDVALKITN